MSWKPTSIPTKILKSSITSVAMTFQVNNILGWNGAALTSGDFGTQAFGVFRNAARTQIELFEFNPTTIASTNITIVRRGLQFDGNVTTEVAGNKFSWTKSDTYVDLGTDTPQLFQLLKEYIDGIAISGAPNASLTVKGIVELATQAEADAKTATGATGAALTVTPDVLRATKYNDYVADTGAANAYVITPVPAITAYAAGQVFIFKAASANTGASTINVSGLGVKTIKKDVSTDVVSGDILANQIVQVVYDGTNFQLTSRTIILASTIQTFNASGTYTKPSGLKYARFQLWAGGGSGASTSTASNEVSGGGGGGYLEVTLAAASIGATETVTIGVGGTAVSGAANGVTGGTTTFGSLLAVYGGGGGFIGTVGAGGGGGGGAVAAGSQSSSAEGGRAGDNTATSGGGSTIADGLNAWGGAGGAACTATPAAGNGGSSYMGGGGGGAAGNTTQGAGGTSVFGGAGGAGITSPTVSATAGSQPGGGGGAKHSSAGTGNSGAGGAGKIVVTEYYV